MHTIGFEQVIDGLQNALKSGNVGLAEEILWPALDQRPEYPILWFYGGALLSMKGLHVLAAQCFQKSYDLEPHPAIWSNIGACLRQSQDVEGCRRVLEIGLEHAPDEPHILANLCGSYVNEGNPEPGIAYGERVADNPEAGPACKFNLALLHLEAGNYGRGFDLYAQGEHKLRELRTYDPDPPLLTPELHEQLKGQGKRIIVHGEQGLGDELMMATMLESAKKDYEIVLDHHPRLTWLFQNSRWMNAPGHPITMHPTRKIAEKGWSEQADAKIAIGNLGQFYRRKAEDFPAGPQYSAPENLRQQYREHLEKIAKGRMIIGLATRGGTMQTARLYRLLPLDIIEKLVSDDRYLFVCMDYEDMTPLAEHINAKFGPGRYVWHPSVVWHYDYEHTAALVAATDAVVTVTQTIAHLSASMGHPTFVLTPSRPDWRMGLQGETWYWYPGPNVRLLRQQGDDFNPAVESLLAALEAHSIRRAA
jgi:tetratricopeptide (TPR) repeat protein